MAAPKQTADSHAPKSARLAKLTRPRSDGLIVRQRLFELLDLHREAPMVWVTAPPGAGKTSLLSTYLDAGAQPVAWVQIDSGDADPATFFHYLTRATSAITDCVPPLPVFSPQDSTNPAAFARRYFREWFAITVEGTTLVLDNLQEAGDATSWHAILATLVEETPAGVRTIAISREGLPAELARARLARQVHLIEWRDLRLTREEAAELALQFGLRDASDLSDMSGMSGASGTSGVSDPSNLSNLGNLQASGTEALIDHLWEQSQGWAAGLVLLLERFKQSGALQPEAFAGQSGGCVRLFCRANVQCQSTEHAGHLDATVLSASNDGRKRAGHKPQ